MTVTTEPETTVKPIWDCQVLDALQEIVYKFGEDYVYKAEDPRARCLHRENGVPSCLVGQVLERLTPDFIPREVGVSAQRAELHALGYSSNATYALQIAQCVQDRRHSWGAALTAARAVLDHEPADW